MQATASNRNGITTKLSQVNGTNTKASFGNPFRNKLREKLLDIMRKDRINNRCFGKMVAIALKKNYIP
jgi:hypothetical protein